MAATEAVLLFASPRQDADLLYLSGFDAPGPLALVLHQGHRILLAPDLELDRARRCARADEVVRAGTIQKELQARGERRSDLMAATAAWLRGAGVERLLLPGAFPFGEAEWLRSQGFQVAPLLGPVAPERRAKTAAEVGAIAAAQAAAEEAMARALELIAAASTGADGTLLLAGTPLTSERIRAAMQKALLDRGCSGDGTIVAGGAQACDPHEEGSGPLRSGTLIILDVFPRSLATRYHADLSRTVLKGGPSPAQEELYEAVRAAQEAAFAEIRPGVNVRAVHQAVQRTFAARGHLTGERAGRLVGFFHGTGHGVGLEIHEAPRVSDCDGVLAENDVITVEPGLYYPESGGVRLEDLVVVRAGGPENLTRAPKELRLP